MDTIFYNGKILTGDLNSPSAEAVAVRAGKIAALGSLASLQAEKNAATELIDLQGRFLLPGFNDSHLHLIGYAANKQKVNLSQCASINDLIREIKNFISANQVPDGGWVFGWGWNHSLFKEKKIPDRHDLDRASTSHCLAMMRTCCHILSVNSQALHRAGIAADPPQVEGGTVDTDRQGISTGILKEQAMQLVLDLIPPPDKEMLKSLIKDAGRDFLAAGLTSVQTDDLAALGSAMLPLLLDAYRELEQEEQLPLRINLQPLLMTMKELQNFIGNSYHQLTGSDYFRIGPLKLLSDGSLGGKTAYLNQPYSGETKNRGMPVLSTAELRELVNLAHRSGMQIAVHAIGDAAIEMVMEAYREANRLFFRPDPRFRIVHASIVNPRALELFCELKALADVQPSFTATDHAYIDQNLGAERAAWAYRWKDLLQSGINLGGGSDCPVETYHPLDGICAAVTRQDSTALPRGGWYPDQRLNVHEAISLYTSGSAYCTFEERRKGKICPGMLADLTVLAEDITAIDPAAIREIKVELTMVGGRIACRRF